MILRVSRREQEKKKVPSSNSSVLPTFLFHWEMLLFRHLWLTGKMDSQTIREAIGQPLVLRSLKSNLAHMVEGVVNSKQIFSMGISLIATFYPHPLIMDSFFFFLLFFAYCTLIRHDDTQPTCIVTSLTFSIWCALIVDIGPMGI